MALPRIAVPLALAAMSLAVDGSAGEPHDAGQVTKVRINYVIGAHPDDEFLGWSLVEKRSDVYPVFVIFTKGEATGFGEGGAGRAPPRRCLSDRETQRRAEGATGRVLASIPGSHGLR